MNAASNVPAQLKWEAVSAFRLIIARNARTQTSHSLETSVTFPLYVLNVLLREPIAAQILTRVTSLPCK